MRRVSRVVVCGGGVCGLIAAAAFARDGHDVTVLERDPAAPPDPDDAWDDWERRGVNQFRLPHFLLPAFRGLIEAELPQVAAALDDAGAYRFNILGPGAPMLDPDGKFEVLTARRPVLEAAVAAAAEAMAGVTVRRGTAIAGLLTGAEARPGVPHVNGVLTESGEEIAADLVLDATGRRSPLPRWLGAIGARPLHEEEEDSGFVYYGRHFVSNDGGPLLRGPSYTHHGSVSLLLLPGDHGTAGVGLVTSSLDAQLRVLREEGPWRRVMAALPNGQRVLDASVISPLVNMAKLEDRHRRMVVDGSPVATGVIPVADSWACTNPTLGRGISLGTKHVMAVRDAVRDTGLDDAWKLAIAADEVTERELTPWYRSTIWHDRHRIADTRAAAGLGEPTDDIEWTRFKKVNQLMQTDLDFVKRFLQTMSLEVLPEELIGDPDVIPKLDAVDLDDSYEGPSREELLALAG